MKRRSPNSNFHVFTRCCPTNSNNLSFEISSEQRLVSTRDNQKQFEFDRVFKPSCSQQEIFDTTSKYLVDDMLRGWNGTVFVYGQTGTGKTYTMCGDIHKPINKNSGIIPRALEYFFQRVKNSNWSLEMKYLEIYNEEINDLLDVNHASRQPNMQGSMQALHSKQALVGKTGSKRLRICEDPKTKSVDVPGLTSRYATDLESALSIVEEANSRRITASTLLNTDSSRSHSILTLIYYSRHQDSDVAVRSKLHFVDLAGSESIAKSGAINLRAREAGEINKSLLSLGRVIETLVDAEAKKSKPGHVAYRDSKLTHLLKDSIGGPTRTSMIATINQNELSYEVSKNTLEYASKAMNIKNTHQTSLDIMKVQDCLLNMSKQCEKLQSKYQMQISQNSGVFIPQEDFKRLEKTQDEMMNMKTEYEIMKVKMNEYYLELETIRAEKETLRIERDQTLSKLNTDLLNCQSELAVLRGNESKYMNNMNLVNDIQTNVKNLIRSTAGILSDASKHRESWDSAAKTLEFKVTSFTQNLQTLFTQFSESKDKQIVWQINHLIEEFKSSQASEVNVASNEYLKRVMANVNNSFSSRLLKVERYVDSLLADKRAYLIAQRSRQEQEAKRQARINELKQQGEEMEEMLRLHNQKLQCLQSDYTPVDTPMDTRESTHSNESTLDKHFESIEQLSSFVSVLRGTEFLPKSDTLDWQALFDAVFVPFKDKCIQQLGTALTEDQQNLFKSIKEQLEPVLKDVLSKGSGDWSGIYKAAEKLDLDKRQVFDEFRTLQGTLEQYVMGRPAPTVPTPTHVPTPVPLTSRPLASRPLNTNTSRVVYSSGAENNFDFDNMKGKLRRPSSINLNVQKKRRLESLHR